LRFAQVGVAFAIIAWPQVPRITSISRIPQALHAGYGLIAATSGDVVGVDAPVDGAVAHGLAGVGLVRVALMHLQKLHQARLRMEGGLSAAEAVRTFRPPVFYRALPGMVASVGLWPADLLLRALE